MGRARNETCASAVNIRNYDNGCFVNICWRTHHDSYAVEVLYADGFYYTLGTGERRRFLCAQHIRRQKIQYNVVLFAFNSIHYWFPCFCAIGISIKYMWYAEPYERHPNIFRASIDCLSLCNVLVRYWTSPGENEVRIYSFALVFGYFREFALKCSRMNLLFPHRRRLSV